MWRRRREKARARAARPDAGASGGAGTGAPGAGDKHLPGRIPSGPPGQARRAWRMDRRGAARVALTPPAEFSRRTTQDQPADMVPAPAGWPANGRLGRNMASVYCIRCGQENPEGARYCSHCGNPLAPVGRGSGEGLAETTSVISAVGSATVATTVVRVPQVRFPDLRLHLRNQRCSALAEGAEGCCLRGSAWGTRSDGEGMERNGLLAVLTCSLMACKRLRMDCHCAQSS